MTEAFTPVNLSFMYRYCGKHRYAMSECIAIPELQKRLAVMAEQGMYIDKQAFAHTLKDVYAYKSEHKQENPTFCYVSARKILKELGENVPVPIV